MSKREPHKRRRKGQPTAEDLEIWQRVAATARPQTDRFDRVTEVGLPEPEEPLPPRAAPPPKPAKARPLIQPAPPPTPAPPRPSALSHGDLSRMDKRTADRFRRGQMRLDGRLDLHGMVQAEAHRALIGFIYRSWEQGRRCVLVVTGKGLRSEDGTGVLRRMVPRWLNDPGLRGMILSFTHAQPRDGGDGALYVLLKRRRED